MTTSGTAAVNLHPAVVEADYSRVPLVVLTADRPEELRGVGANQTIDQVRLYGVVGALLLRPLGRHRRRPGRWRTLVEPGARPRGRRAGAPQRRLPRAAGPRRTTRPAPTASTARRPRRRARGGAGGHRRPPLVGLPAARRRRAGPSSSPATRRMADARGLAEAGGWPLLAEPSSGHRGGPNAIGTYRLLLDAFADDVERVVVAGRPTLSRPVTRLLARDDVDVFRLRDDPTTPSVTGTAGRRLAGPVAVRRRRRVRGRRPGARRRAAVRPGRRPGGRGSRPADGLLVAGLVELGPRPRPGRPVGRPADGPRQPRCVRHRRHGLHGRGRRARRTAARRTPCWATSRSCTTAPAW